MNQGLKNQGITVKYKLPLFHQIIIGNNHNIFTKICFNIYKYYFIKYFYYILSFIRLIFLGKLGQFFEINYRFEYL